VHVCARAVVATLLVVANLFATRPAHADDGVIDPAARKDRNAYRGRLGEDHVDEPFLWIPRVIFFPFYLVAEFVIRRPIYALAEWTDRSRFVPRLMRVLHPVPDFQWSPSFNVDFGVAAWVGAHLVLRNLFVRHNDLQSSIALGINVLDFDARDEWRRGPLSVGIRQHAGRRNQAFYGLGPDSPNVQTNFALTQWDAGVYGAVDAGKHVRVELSEAFRRELLGPGLVSPSIESVFETQALPGYEDANLATIALSLRVDTRSTSDQPSGVRIVASGRHARDVLVPDRSFLAGQVDAQAAVEVSRPGRVISLRFYGADTLPTGSEPVPFAELAQLGGLNHLGFYWGRFRGEAAVMAELRYRYPIAYDGDAQLVLSAGNAFARDFHDFDVGRLTASFAVGLRTRKAGVLPIDLLVGLGTTRFDQSFAVDSVRLFVGTDLGL